MKTIENYEVLESFYGDRIYILEKNSIERCFLYNCYNDYGQQIGHTDAGDYSLHNVEGDSALYNMRQEGCKVFGEGFADIELCYDDEDIYISNYDELEGVTASEEEINEWINEWEKNNANYITTDVITFWNGHNMESHMLDAEECFADLQRIDGSEILADFEKALQRGDVSKSDYKYEYRGDVYRFEKDSYNMTFYDYEVTKLADIEEE